MTAPFRSGERPLASIIRLRPATPKPPRVISIDLDDHRDRDGALSMVVACLIDVSGLQDGEIAACMPPLVSESIVARWRAGVARPAARELLILVALAGAAGLQVLSSIEFAEEASIGGGCRG